MFLALSMRAWAGSYSKPAAEEHVLTQVMYNDNNIIIIPALLIPFYFEQHGRRIHQHPNSKCAYNNMENLYSEVATQYIFVTCNELKIVNSQAKAVVLRLSVKIPKSQVAPSRGRRINTAFMICLL